MRFEIGPGGVVMILVGLLGLSGVVFGLGLIAGHELAGPEPGAQQVASAYPLPAAPASESTASASDSSVATSAGEKEKTVSSSSSAQTSGSETASAPKPLPAKPAVAPAVASRMASSSPPASATSAAAHKTTSSKTLAVSSSRSTRAMDSSAEDLHAGAGVAPPPSVHAASSATDEASANEDDEESEPPAPAPERPIPHKRVALANPPAPSNPASNTARHPYSIQIDAVMDWQGAQQMAQRLRAKGFQPFIVKTQLAGRTWYRLRVGHYSTPQEAQAAEAKLHQEFNSTPASH